MIPFIIHQIYWDFSGKNQEMPEKWKLMSERTRDRYKKWSYKLWNYKDCLNLVKDKFPKLLDLWISLSPIEKCDLVRYMILYLYGGYYIDMDIEIVNDCLEKWSVYDIVLYNEEVHTKYIMDMLYIFNNCLMGSIENNQFWMNCIHFTTNGKIFNILPYTMKVLLFGPLNIQYNYYKYSKDRIFVILHPSSCIKHEKKLTWRSMNVKKREKKLIIVLVIIILFLLFYYLYCNCD